MWSAAVLWSLHRQNGVLQPLQLTAECKSLSLETVQVRMLIYSTQAAFHTQGVTDHVFFSALQRSLPCIGIALDVKSQN